MMSGAENSFEEIEKPLGKSSTSDQESSDLINDQHLASESSATTMTNSTEDQAKIGQLNDLEFELAWKTRDEIICHLNLHKKLLSGLIIKADTREKLLKANNELVTTLMNLPLKVDDQLRGFESLESSLGDGLNEVVLDLSMNVKSRIMDTLVANHHILLGANSVASELKSKLIDQNNDLIYELLKLRPRTVSEGDHHIDQAAKANGKSDNSKKSDGSVDAMLQAQTPVEKPVANCTASCKVAEDVAVLKGELEKLKERIKEVDVRRSEATFTFEVNDVESLFSSLTNTRSEFFYCRGMPWYLSVEGRCDVSRVGRTKYLSVYLYCNNNLIKEDEWSVVGTLEVRLLGAVGGDLVRTLKDKIFNSDSMWGWKEFISMDKLHSDSFIQEDTIKIRVHLTTKKFERSYDNCCLQ